MAMYHPNLDFATIYSGYVDGLSTEDIQSLEKSLLPDAKLVAEQGSAQWVMDGRRTDMAGSVRQEDVALRADGVEPGLEVDVAPSSTEPNVVLPGSEQPMPSPVAPTTDAAGQPQ